MSRDLTAGMIAEVTARQLSPILLLKAEFDSGDLLLWSGIGSLTFNSEVYTGAGALLGISEMQEVTQVEAQGATFQLTSIPDQFVSLALSENYQRRPITCWLGALDSSGALVPDPVILFKGRMDVLQIDDDGAASMLAMQAENRLIDLKRARVRRYTPEDQKQQYAGDLGLDFVASLQEKEVIWGKTTS